MVRPLGSKNRRTDRAGAVEPDSLFPFLRRHLAQFLWEMNDPDSGVFYWGEMTLETQKIWYDDADEIIALFKPFLNLKV